MGIGTYADNRETLSTTLDQCLDRYAIEILPVKLITKNINPSFVIS